MWWLSIIGLSNHALIVSCCLQFYHGMLFSHTVWSTIHCSPTNGSSFHIYDGGELNTMPHRNNPMERNNELIVDWNRWHYWHSKHSLLVVFSSSLEPPLHRFFDVLACYKSCSLPCFIVLITSFDYCVLWKSHFVEVLFRHELPIHPALKIRLWHFATLVVLVLRSF